MTARFNVRIEPHARKLEARATESILDAALAAGLNLPHSCKSGHCSSCKARVLAGEIRYPDDVLPPGITPAEAAAGEALLCRARAASDVVVEARIVASVADVEVKTLPCRIERVVPLAADVLQVWLRLPAVETLEFRAGQYVDILAGDGRRRSFSIASPPHDSKFIELHVRRAAAGGFTSSLFEPDARGRLLHIEGPLGQFVYEEGVAPVIMIAGGTGFAPLKSMLRHALERGAPRPIELYWGARTPADLYEEALIERWAREYPALRYTGVLSERADEGRRAGYVHDAVLADHATLAGYDVYAAGPPQLIEAIRASFPVRGLAEGRLRFDSFDYAPR